jgi:salicylate hydroxylase
MHAIVVGAGIGGLATALACHQAGIAVTLLEQAGALKEIDAGIQISSNGTRVLRELGLLDATDASISSRCFRSCRTRGVRSSRFAR